MSLNALISRLDGVKPTGSGRWVAKCPAHDDRHASLAIRELDDGRVLLHDFAGCDTQCVLAAVGLTFDDLFPEHALNPHSKPERRPFNTIDVFRCVAFEALIVAIAAAKLAKQTVLTDQDYQRLMLASSRLQHAVGVVNGF